MPPLKTSGLETFISGPTIGVQFIMFPVPLWDLAQKPSLYVVMYFSTA